MTKLVWKTIAITLASALGALMLAFGSLALFSPITLASFFDNAGNRSVALFYYEKQYQKTGGINDLGVLALKIDDKSNSKMAEKYLADLVSHKDFDKYCKKQDLSGSDVSSVENRTVKIFTQDDLNYYFAKDENGESILDSEGYNIGLKKAVSLTWYNKTEDNKFVGFEEGIFRGRS